MTAGETAKDLRVSQGRARPPGIADANAASCVTAGETAKDFSQSNKER